MQRYIKLFSFSINTLFEKLQMIKRQIKELHLSYVHQNRTKCKQTKHMGGFIYVYTVGE